MKEEFKTFVKGKPELASYVLNGRYSWQQFYEIWDLYGEDHNIWQDYSGNPTSTSKLDNNLTNDRVNPSSDFTSFNDIFDLAKKVDMEKVRGGINYAQKALGVLGDFVGKNKGVTSSVSKVAGSYTPRPIHRFFED